MSELRHFTFMESWLDDMEDWSQEEKNDAIWRIIKYGIYGEEDLDKLPAKERSWYKNIFRVIDKGYAISEQNSERGRIGGLKNAVHNHEMIVEALANGCKTAKEIAEFIEGPGASSEWIYKTSEWKNRWKLLESIGIPLENWKLSKIGKRQNDSLSKNFPLESDEAPGQNFGKSLESTGIPLEFQWKVDDF